MVIKLSKKKKKKGQEKCATESEKQYSAALADQIQQIVAPYFLRREKKNYLSSQPNQNLQQQHHQPNIMTAANVNQPQQHAADIAAQHGSSQKQSPLISAAKHDFILWICINDIQVTRSRENLVFPI